MTVKWHDAKADPPERILSDYMVVVRTILGVKIKVLRYQWNGGNAAHINDGWTWCTFENGFYVCNQDSILYWAKLPEIPNEIISN